MPPALRAGGTSANLKGLRGACQRPDLFQYHITCRGDTCYHVMATVVPKIIGAVPGIQHGESRVTTVGLYSPNVAISSKRQSIITDKYAMS